MMLTDSQRDLLAQMRADNRASPPPFRTHGWWEEVGGMFNDWFNKDGIKSVIDQPYNFHFAGMPFHDSTVEDYLSWMTGSSWHRKPNVRVAARDVMRRRLLNNHSNIALATSILADVMPKPPWGVLTAIECVASFMPVVGEDAHTFVDLGAGWGRIGYVLCSHYPNIRYIICDLPESLLISSTFLPRMLPDIHHGAYNELDDRPGCYYLAASRILDLADKEADLIINIASFQEMTDGYVDAYFDIIDQKGKHLYTLQKGQPNGRLKCPERPHWELLFSRHPLWSGKYYEALFRL